VISSYRLIFFYLKEKNQEKEEFIGSQTTYLLFILKQFQLIYP